MFMPQSKELKKKAFVVNSLDINRAIGIQVTFMLEITV